MVLESLIVFLGSVFFYGIGLNRVLLISESIKDIKFLYLKSLLCSFATVALSSIIVTSVLSPLGLQEFFPFICILIFIVFSTFLEIILQLASVKGGNEFFVSFFSILLAISESLSILEALLYVFVALTSFYTLVLITYTVRKRSKMADPLPVFKNAVILFSLAILVLFILAFDVSWLTGGIAR